MNGIELIAKERDRQINGEGFTADHDSQYKNEELVLAAIAYIEADETDNQENLYTPTHSFWPLSSEWWKPGDRIRNLVKAGALIAAEIDRLLAMKDNQ